MPHLLSVWPGVEERLTAASRVLVFLDYDGTLTPIVSRPELAILSPETRSVLQELNAREKFVLGVISGRDLADVQSRVGVPGIVYAGNHGMEIDSDQGRFLHPEAEAARSALVDVYQELSDKLGHVDGVIVENKGLTLSLHFRLTPEDQCKEVEETFGQILSGRKEFRVTKGKMVLEVRPDIEWDKGKAIARIADGYPGEPLSVFFGDDLTDEAGFEVVQQRGGIAVYVGPARQPTRALHRVDSPDEVVQTLELMSQL